MQVSEAWKSALAFISRVTAYRYAAGTGKGLPNVERASSASLAVQQVPSPA